jgi:hypothetical protein
VQVDVQVDVEQPQRSVMALFTGGVPLVGPPAPAPGPRPGVRKARRS